MSKKVNYFSHDFGARNDPRLVAVQRKCEINGFLGLAGIGTYWALAEMLHEAGGMLKCDNEALEDLSYSLRCPMKILEIVIFDCDLFVIENYEFYSKRVNESLKKINEISEARKEAGRRGAQKRWQENSNCYEDNSNCQTKDGICYENDSKAIAKNSKKRKKEINKKINKNTLNSLTNTEVCEEAPISDETSDIKSVKSVFFKKFFEKFPKKTHEKEAEIAFISLSKSELEEISRVFPFWLEYWKTIDPNYIPNAYSWIFNKSWREKIPEKMGNFQQTQNIGKIKIPDETPKIDEKKREQEAVERGKILQFFDTLDDTQKVEILEKIEKKYAELPVKKGDTLWQIEVAKLTKPLMV